MRTFILIALAIYLIPHVALFFRLSPLVAPGMRLPLLLGLLSLMGTFFAGFALRRHDDPFSRAFIELSFFWMAFVFWALCAGLLMDAWNLLIRLVPAAHRPAALAPLTQLRVLIGMTILLFSWSAGEARRLRPKFLDLPGLTAPRPLTLAYFSDLHLSPFGNHAAAERTLDVLEAAKPDVILCGGDLLDAPAETIRDRLQAFARLKPPLGKFAVLGNHEYYAGLSNSLEACRQAGFRVLRGERVEPIPGLVIAGVDDLHGRATHQPCYADEDRALPPATNGLVILLKHKPDVSAEAAERASLQLSGHTHGGQIFPFHLMVRLFFKQGFGLYEKGDNRWLYVSRGAGTWGPRLRLFAPPEVVLVRVGEKRSDQSSVISDRKVGLVRRGPVGLMTDD